MKIQVKIPVVVCRDGSYNAWGLGIEGGKKGEIDEGLIFDNWDAKVSDSDLQMLTVTAEIDVDALFAEKTITGKV